jgi:hypothetical protein
LPISLLNEIVAKRNDENNGGKGNGGKMGDNDVDDDKQTVAKRTKTACSWTLLNEMVGRRMTMTMW